MGREEGLTTFLAAKEAYEFLKADDVADDVGDELNRWEHPSEMPGLAEAIEDGSKRTLFAARPMTARGVPGWAFDTSDFLNDENGRLMKGSKEAYEAL